MRMNLDKWKDIKLNIKEKFSIIDSGQDSEELDNDHQQKIDWIEFESPVGTVRLEFISSPKVMGKNTAYSNRIGSDMKVDYIYSEDEIVNHLKAYRYNEDLDDWEGIEASSFS
jgi:hypothetical protein